MAYIDREQVCEKCNNKNYCEKEKCPVYKVSTADVVPKSEVAELKAIIADHKANEERWQELYADTVDKWEKAYKELEIKLENARADVAREIFEEIESRLGIGHDILDAWEILAELKNKYTEEKE